MRTVKVGAVPTSKDGTGLSFWNLKDGEALDLTVLANIDQIVSVDQFAVWDFNPAAIWTSIGSEDPGYELGLKPNYKAFIPVAFRNDDGDSVVKLWAVGIQIHRTLAEISEMMDGLAGVVVRAKRIGTGLSTRYTVMASPKGKPIKDVDPPTVDDVVALLGPEDREGIIELIVSRAGMGWDRVKAKLIDGDDSSSSDSAKSNSSGAVEVEETF